MNYFSYICLLKQKYMINSIVIYDFDKSLFFTPENTDDNRRLWESMYGIPWKYKGNGWWSKAESLDRIFDIRFNTDLREFIENDMKCDITHTVLLTGRMPRFEKRVKEILETEKILFDDYFFNDISDTLTFKLGKIKELRERFPEAKSLTIYEDRLEHIPHFDIYGKNNFETYKMNIIK